ncbi:Hypothetical protein R9X50_00675500 [Acrodontium crateriforme]|uniref:Scramblase-domain-containing protein n=1 Tax=Acrodontium crateriforme TaxID=150365 RepID=A0AAQ3MDH7_9PEZI|nr:Hypothetical protein R9X50_00675500 [Acrodontium crateriforme]
MATPTARWSLRLSRSILSRYSSPQAARVQLLASSQRRWIQKPAKRERPPPRTRPWGALSTNDSHVPSQPQEHPDGQKTPYQHSQHNENPETPAEPQPGPNQRLATALAESDSSDLVSEVHIPKDVHGVLPENHPALSLLGNSSLVIQRQIEFMNIIIGVEQANRYIIMDGQGQTIGYIAERDHGIGSTVARQMFRTHRSFTTHIFDREEREVLRVHRPFSWINSNIRIYDPVPEGGYTNMESSSDLQGTSTSSALNQGTVAQVSPLKLEEMRIIGEAKQQWAPLRRKYNLFSYRPLDISTENNESLRTESGAKSTSDTLALTEAKIPEQAIEAGMVQFAHVNEPFLSWDFHLRDENQNDVGSVNRNFSGFAREIFTDTGVYVLRMDSAAQNSTLLSQEGQELQKYQRDATAMTLDQRAVMLATAVSIDFDYFSRHSGVGGGGFMPIWFPMGGGTTAAEGAAGAGAAGVGVGAAEAGAGVVGGAARGVGGAAVGEGAIAGAGTMAGYEAMQRGVYGPHDGAYDASPQSQAPPEQPQEQGNWWGDDNNDPWSGGSGDSSPTTSAGSGGGDGGGGGGGVLDAISDFFGD